MEHLIAKVEYKGTEYYFNADIVGGVFGSGKAEEFEMKDRGFIFRYGCRYMSWKK